MMLTELRYIWLLLATNMKAAMTMRAAYLIRAAFGFVIHAIYIVVWFFMFKAVPSIGGWRVEHFMLSYGIATAVWGMVAFFTYGLRKLPQQIERGELDIFLTQPRSLLVNIALGETQAGGPAEILFGLILIVWVSLKTATAIPAVLLVTLCAFVVYCSIILAWGSLGFWLKEYHQQAEELNYIFFLFATRPAGVFKGWMLPITLTIVPVAFMTHIPLEYLVDHKIEALWMTLGGTIASVIAALTVFRFGLQHYESGNKFGVRG